MWSSFGLKISAISKTNLSDSMASVDILLELCLLPPSAGVGIPATFDFDGKDCSRQPSRSPSVSQETEDRILVTAGRRSEPIQYRETEENKRAEGHWRKGRSFGINGN